MDYHVGGAVLEAYHKLHPKTQINHREALQMIWDSLPQVPINKAVKNFTL